jgi:hypothetical protein
MVGDTRAAIFISHANPQDNAFTLWLRAKLAALGYEVWADVLRLKGGDDWQRKLEQALRHRARKVLLVANAVAVDKQGVRNELQIANDVAKAIGDSEFIVPLRLGALTSRTALRGKYPSFTCCSAAIPPHLRDADWASPTNFIFLKSSRNVLVAHTIVLDQESPNLCRSIGRANEDSVPASV